MKRLKYIYITLILSLFASVGIAFCSYATVPNDMHSDMNTVYDPGNTIFDGNRTPIPDLIDASSDSSDHNLELVVESACQHAQTSFKIENEKHATCINDGSYDYVEFCLDCYTDRHRDTKTVAASSENHTLYMIPATAPTCEAAGNVEYYICERCGKWLSRDFVELADPGMVVIPATGHDWGDWTVAQAATCTADGLETAICRNDSSHVDTRMIPGGHSVSEKVETIPATCEEEGAVYHIKFCTVCNDELSRDKTETLPAAGHKPGTAVEENRIDAQSTNGGSYDEVVYCQTCKKVLSRVTREIPAPMQMYQENTQTPFHESSLPLPEQNINENDEYNEPPCKEEDLHNMHRTPFRSTRGRVRDNSCSGSSRSWSFGEPDYYSNWGGWLDNPGNWDSGSGSSKIEKEHIIMKYLFSPKIELSTISDLTEMVFTFDLNGDHIKVTEFDSIDDIWRSIQPTALLQNALLIEVADMTQIIKAHESLLPEKQILDHQLKLLVNIGAENAERKYKAFFLGSNTNSVIPAGTVTASSIGEVMINTTKQDGMMLFLFPDDEIESDNFLRKLLMIR